MAFFLGQAYRSFVMARELPVQPGAEWSQDVCVRADDVSLDGILDLPAGARGLVIFAHGSGSSRLSGRNQRVARSLQREGLGTLLFDLLTDEEERADAIFGQHLRFDIEFLASRLTFATEWARADERTAALPVGYFGASTGAAAALVAAAQPGAAIGAVVSRGGRPDLAGSSLAHVQSPTLLIVGGADHPVIPLNEQAYARLGGEKEIEIVPGATHLFEEPGALERVAELAAAWFNRHLPAGEGRR